MRENSIFFSIFFEFFRSLARSQKEIRKKETANIHFEHICRFSEGRYIRKFLDWRMYLRTHLKLLRGALQAKILTEACPLSNTSEDSSRGVTSENSYRGVLNLIKTGNHEGSRRKLPSKTRGRRNFSDNWRRHERGYRLRLDYTPFQIHDVRPLKTTT